MLTKLATTIAVGVLAVAFVLPAADAEAFSEPIPTKISLLKWGGNPRVGKLYKIVSKGATFPLPAEGTGPDVNGGSLLITVGAGEVTCDLSNTANWKALGNPAGSKGYKYVNKSAPTGDLCKVVIVKEKVIKVLAKGVGSVALPGDAGTNPDVSMELNVGLDSYCAEAIGPHFKEKAETLIKMKDQAAPASCAKCGDNSVNQPGEECDGTDDSACPGGCVAPGGGGGTCGDNIRNGGAECTCAAEQCDVADASDCPGLCLSNCTCPEPICNNGVKEVGEECDTMGDCPPGQTCGGFCKCVDDGACNCGTPEPTQYMFTSKAPVQPSCGTTDGEAPLDSLECGGLYFGGGETAAPLPLRFADEGESKFNIAQCTGTNLTLTHKTRAEVGPRSCTEGKKCNGGANDGQPCIRDRQCEPGGFCEGRCFFGAPFALLDLGLPALSNCVVIEMADDCSGGLNCATGEALIRVPFDAKLHLTLGDQSASVPGHNPCPICLGGTLNVVDSGTCEGGPNNGQPCTPMSTSYDLGDCCAGGPNNSKPCSDDSDCPTSTCVSGCTSNPTSHDCPPSPLAFVGGLLAAPVFTPDTSSKTADGNGNFCGWCRDVEVEGSKCFEGDPDTGGAKSCPDSAVIYCRPATFNGPGGGDPADIVECGDPLPCRTDADCTAPYETCEQKTQGAFADATVSSITYSGIRSDPLSDGLPHDAAIGAAFCLPPSFTPAIDNQANLGGPAGLSLEVEMQLSPSGAFLALTQGLLD